MSLDQLSETHDHQDSPHNQHQPQDRAHGYQHYPVGGDGRGRGGGDGLGWEGHRGEGGEIHSRDFRPRASDAKLVQCPHLVEEGVVILAVYA